MADNTSNYGLPYPEPRDGVVVHSDIERLARRVDSVLEPAVVQARDAAIQDATQKYGDLPQRVSDTETGLTQMIPKAEADQYITPGPPGPGGSIALEETDPGCFADSEITWVQWNAAGTEASVWNPVHNRYELLHTADHIRVDTSVGTRVYVGDTMIHGDTGWRDLTPYLEPGVTPSTNLGEARFKRVDNRVYVEMKVDIGEEFSGSTIAVLPDGFRSTYYRYLATPYVAEGPGRPASSMAPFPVIGYSDRRFGIRTPLSNTFSPNSTVVWVLDYDVEGETWPVSLPSTPA